MISHRLAAALFAAALLLAIGWIGALSSMGAKALRPGESVVAIFPLRLGNAEVVARIAAAQPRQFEPLAWRHAWLVQAGDAQGLAQALRRRGAWLVLRARGPVHFALGCAAPG